MCDTHKPNNRKNDGSCKKEDHVKWNRRSFLQALGLAGGGSMMLANTALSVTSPSPLSMALGEAENDKVLILCRLAGGNDGFNTIIPVYDYDSYANARPGIKVNAADYISLNDDFAIPKSMAKLESIWGNGKMRVVHGVGYEDPSLSHFKGSDIIASSNTSTIDKTGILGRYFQEQYPDYILNPPASPPSLQIGSIGNLIFKGPENDFSFVVSNPNRLVQIAENGTSYSTQGLGDCTYGDKLRHLREVTNITFNYADVISQAYNRSNDFGEYLDDDIGKQLSVISRLIKGNLGTKVYMVTVKGFDTHNNQIERHDKLLTSFADAMSTFYKDLEGAGWDDKVLTMTMSEFGRRFKENGSKGTDHGTAAPMLFFGTGLDGNGFAGEHPDLSNLTRGGNVFHTTDFRQVYATVLKDWLCVDEEKVGRLLLGGDFESLDLGFNCNSTSEHNPSQSIANLDHVVSYSDNQTYIHLTNLQTMHVDIILYNIIGKKIATLKNEVLVEGKHTIDVKQAAKINLGTGPYVYQIKTNNGNFSKTLLIS